MNAAWRRRWLRGRWLLRQRFDRDLFAPRGRVASSLHRFPFVIASFFATLGVIGDALWYESFWTSVTRWLWIGMVAGLLPELVHRVFQPSRPGSEGLARAVTWTCNAVLWTCCFGTLHAWSEASFRSASILALVDQSAQPIVVRGTLDRTVSLRRNPVSFGRLGEGESPWQSQLTVNLQQRRVEDGFEAIGGKVLVYVDGDMSELRPGDRMEIYGWLHPFEGPTNPGEPDLRPAYRRRGLHARIETKNAGAVTLLETSSNPIASAVASIATRGRESLLRHTDDQTGPLAVALVIGQREFVDPKTRDALLATGTAHLLSVSGMHLAILVLVATWVVSALGLQPTSRFVVIVAISALYVAVTGGRPPVMRAAILISMLLLSTCVRRTSQPLNTLGVAALVLIVVNPMNVFAVGVHLSFLAVITLMLAGRPIAPGSMRSELELQRETGFQSMVEASSSSWVRNLKTVARFVGQMAWLSGCVTAVSLPLVWSQFHLVSLVSVLTNVLVWAGLMVALPAGVLTVIVDPVHSWLGAVPGTVCHVALRYMWWIIEWTATWPRGHAWLPSPPGIGVALFYAVMAASLIWRTRPARWFRCGWVLVWGVLMFWVATRVAALPPDTIEATFIDVGHGTSVIVRTPDEKIWLYDCGRMGNRLGTSRDIDTALWSLGVTGLDGVFLSHADADHYNALPAILDRFSVDVLITPPGMLGGSDAALADVRSAVRRHRIAVREVSADDRDALIDAAGMAVLHPPRAGIAGSDNANSLVLRIDHGGRALILPGDLEPPGTESLVSRPRPTAGGVLMAPHHGSLSMDADVVLAWARPRETIVSGSRRAARTEVEAMLSVTGSGVHITAREGAIRVRLDGSGQIDVRKWLVSPW
ncbi:ComEC family competence protein [Stieleria neptunia]|uniref:ComEC family competence protein n=1 Tax=Stieleria neptunia TaxID=2527979 RepID=A0A518I4F1_9BACT|nr:ComEC/Rec2 family competence protein [Stieleria neptunia]QDV47985.1 ComEC family competence protein [Stieleria neptunia]